MKIGAAGLSAVRTQDLKILLKYLYRSEVRCPIDVSELARCGLQHTAEPLLRQLHGLDKQAVLAVVVAVIAERLEVERATLERADQARYAAARDAEE